ncbi:hypothetical protein EJ06DRAFT_527318 [Trichodelitschia bisporula]|uniref:U4/U6 snRNA-associated-splicing factor PRP24 n=1 Tax=Trichodelitschia bisporula TaxID=703511 RepID=A0A6G1I699_9PEZI|nr:hypothetical protein EJ06DRAFT_527318 [Trichodelitschia bisporula]
MDINSLLSPQDPSPADASPRSSPNRSQWRPPVQQRRSSGLSQQLSHSPRVQEQRLPSIAARNAAAAYHYPQPHGAAILDTAGSPYQQQQATAGYASTSALSHPADGHTPAQSPTRRQGSTPGMDALADIASMQHRQSVSRQSSSGSHERSTVGYAVHPQASSVSAHSPAEMSMSDTTPQTPRIYIASALSDSECQTVTELAKHLAENSFDFQAHVQFIGLLHNGFVEHTRTGGDPHRYELLVDLRQARQSMDGSFPVGEKMWADWLEDEKLLARSIDERTHVIELFKRAVTDEPSSAKLWRLYGDYMHYLWATTYDINGGASTASWTADDKEIGKELFKWDPMMDVWELGCASTQWRLNDSHVVWDGYIQVLMQSQRLWPAPEKIANIRTKFTERLQRAHATWEETFQMFSTFISTYDNAAYEDTMVATSRLGIQPKKVYSVREQFELNLQRAAQSGDEQAEWAAYSDYLSWEVRKRGVFSFNLINGLYERATIRFPSVASLWIDYVEFLIENDTKDIPIIAVLERATRHCPWSGDLWAHRLLALEAEGKEFGEIEDVKHKATATGLLDVGGIDELLKVYVAWCGCLRRRAFEPSASEDELDIAEVAIRSALEHVKKAREKLLGKDAPPDPQYRLEKIHIKFLTQRGDITAARDIWRQLMPAQGNSYDFWYRCYIWEMVIWSRFAVWSTGDPNMPPRTPQEATAVLRRALKRVATLDWPEPLISMYLSHCEQHESVMTLRTAIIEVRKATATLAKRREEESLAASQLAHQAAAVAGPSTSVETPGSGKRKRDLDVSADEVTVKKAKSAEPPPELHSSSTQPLKRDREHTIVVVKKLPLDATTTRVRQFFRDCGTINSLRLLVEGNHQVATIEFETQEDALFAQTKVTKLFDGYELEIDMGTGSTVWVTNYPPTADEAYMRDLFKDCGEIVEVRFPSLQGNTNRRFCYVQFANSVQAVKATHLDGKRLDSKYVLHAKISDPARRESRHGAIYDGREVYAKDVDWSASEADVQKHFEQCGAIERIRIPRNLTGKSKGIAFVIFEDKSSAELAVQKLNQTTLRSRTITVELSQPKARRTATTIIRQNTHSPSPGPSSPGISPSVGNSDTGAHTSEASNPRSIKARTMALLGVPDTVTSARLEQLLQIAGPIKKLSLRPDHGGAIVEFMEERSVGVASLSLEGKELDGKHVRTGTVGELLKEKPVVKNTRLGQGKKSARPAAALGSGVISRPGQSSRRGGRGGLGFRKSEGSIRAEAGNTEANTKTNADFRNLVLGGERGKEGS